MRIFNKEPNNWRELQEIVGQMFRECNFETQVSKKVDLVRGSKEIDVYTQDLSSEYKPIFLVECKHWDSPVNQEVIHSFRTVVSDFGANIGFIVSKNGFQSGCYKAIEKTNIKLVSLDELGKEYYPKWKQAMAKKYVSYADKLFPYWDYTSGRGTSDGSLLSYDTQLLVREAYLPICSLGPMDFFERGFERKYPVKIPTINDNFDITGYIKINDDRDYFDFCEKNKEQAVRHFKLLFKEI